MKKSLTLLLILFCIGAMCMNTSAQDKDIPITMAGAEIEAEDFTFKTEVDDVYSWEIVGDTLAPGMSNGMAIQASPGDSVKSYKDDYETLSPSVSYEVNFEEAGTYYFYFRANTFASGDKNSCHFGVSDGTDTTTFTRVEFDDDIDTWHWSNETKDGDTVSYEVTTPGTHELTIWVREIGTVIDKFIISGDKDLPFITLAGAEIEAENFTFTTEVDDVYSWEIVGDTLAPGMSNGLAIQASPGDSVESFKDDYETLSPSASYEVNFEEAGTYYFFFRANTFASGDKNSCHFGVSDSKDTTTFTRVEFDDDIDTWHWSNETKDGDTVSYEVTTPGLHELTIWVREIGTVIDKILVTGEKDLVVNATGVSLDQITATVGVGSTVQLTATVAPENATDKSVTWSSSDDAVATVDANGLVTGVSAGAATITVTTIDGGLTATADITVEASQVISVTGVALDQSSLTLEPGGTATLVATVSPAEATDKSVSWSSTDDAVATVSDGLVTAVAIGTCTITVTTTDGEKTATCEVTVATTGIQEHITGFRLYPNPVTGGRFTIEVSDPGIRAFEICNLLGVVIHREEVNAQKIHELDTPAVMESGIYFIKMIKNKSIAVEEFIVK